jgi:hypothetical protein
MIKFINKLFIAIFYLCLFVLGAEIYSILKHGFNEGKEIWYQVLIIVSLVAAALYFLRIFYNTSKSDKT